jgi:asparagine synthase (glutamine-hydrolysing)
MCGIAGILYPDSTQPVDPFLLKRMGDAIAHRGPDAEGFLREPGIGLVHRRLSIIDLAGGDQPVGNEDGSVQVVFNGEIYNYQELRDELLAKGHQFRTRSDTEVLVHLYEELGAGLVSRLRGMFAFALWDAKQRQLLLARDRVGQKPLYIYRDQERLLFASELKAILSLPEIDHSIDPAALEDYLTFGFIPGSRSIFRRIEKLPPAHMLIVGPNTPHSTAQRYWSYPSVMPSSQSVGEWCEAIEAKITETVRLHLLADVPVGAFLSGGVDSSVVVAVASKLVSEPLQTFSIGFGTATSELPFARQVAQQFGCRHSEDLVTADAAADLDDLVRYFDEPFADSSAIPTMRVSRLARRHVKVVLSGDGGDEAFGGYQRYIHDLREARLRQWVPAWIRRSLLGPLSRAWPKADWLPRVLRAKTLLANLSLPPEEAYANTMSLCRPPWRRRMMAAGIRDCLNGHRPEAAIAGNFKCADNDDFLSRMIAADVNVVLPDDFLTKVDRASMSCGLEVRPPLVDHELLELTAQIPSQLKVRSGEGKWIFKEAFRNRLPKAICQRPKQGFEMPIDEWLRHSLREVFEDTVLSPQAPIAGLLDQSVVQCLYESHCKGISRNGNVLWSILVLARWCDRYLSSTGSASAYAAVVA